MTPTSLRPLLAAPFLVAALLASSASAHAAEVEATSTVESVVVFPDRARVTRTATVQLSRGPHDLVVAGLPVWLDVSSLRAEGEGSAQVVLGAFDVRRGFGTEMRSARARQITEQLRALEDADKELADAADAARFEIEFVRQLASKSTGQLGSEALERPDRASEARALVDVLGEQLRAGQAELRRVAVERRDLQAQLEAARAELAQLSGTGTDDFRVVVSVQAKKPGSLTLRLTYTAPGASWAPTYDARLYPDEGAVEMTYGAWVRQSTGEDWDDVELVLSTAQPALGLAAPAPAATILRQYSAPARTSSSRSRRGGRAKAEAPSAAYDMDDDWGEAAPEAEEEYYEAETLTATASAAGTSVEFTIPGRNDVPGDSTRKRVTIAAWRTEGIALRYLATPTTSAHVFQSATLNNDRPWPMLAGELQAFMEDRYVGRSSIGEVAPGGELRLPFGVEERLKVERELSDKDSGPKGIAGNKSTEAWSWVTTVTSLLDREVEVELQQTVPVSEYSKYVVKVDDASTEHDSEEGRGVLVWKLPLAAKGSTEVVLTYSVTFPTDERPWGL